MLTKFIRSAPHVIAMLFVFCIPANALDKTPENGMPFCSEKDQLQEYLMALMKKDEAWVKQLGCAVIKGGVRIGIIEDYESSPIGHIAKVRILSTGTVGYGLFF